jgi:pimeloyl-ACP methyl ester carboxylesterase
MTNEKIGFDSRFYSAPDGLRLHVRDFGSPLDPGVPVVCLAGLSRNSTDFIPLASALAGGGAGQRRRVLALDYRGRGLSAYDPDWRNYRLDVEGADILTILAAAGIEAAIFVGTSRGGLHIMRLSGTRPSILHAAVLNDIGPVIEPRGMARIRSYIGKMPVPGTLPDAIDLVKRIMSEHFDGLTDGEWAAYAKATFTDDYGRFGPRYDQNLMKPLEAFDLEQPLPTCWPQFDGLRDIPLLVIRGANSDLFSPVTLDAMTARHKACESYIVEGQGHAPLLLDQRSIERICAFVASADKLPRRDKL